MLFVPQLNYKSITGYDKGDPLSGLKITFGYSEKDVKILNFSIGNFFTYVFLLIGIVFAVLAVFGKLGKIAALWLSATGYVEILNHDVHVHTKSQVFTYRGTLKETEAKLAGKNFSRCHNCFIVNLHYITEVDGENIKLENGTNLYLSRNRKKAFLADLTSYLISIAATCVAGFAKKLNAE